jgi:TPR repeat protein
MRNAFAAFVFLALIGVVSGCNHPDSASETNPVSIGQICIANSIGALRILPKLPSCTAEDSSCRDACLSGDAASCLSSAYAVQKKSSTENEAVQLFHRSCILGSANGCTNYAANIWANPHTDAQLACARRTFEKACQAKEAFACGMVGRIMLEGSTTPDQAKEGRRYLEAACDELEGFPCRVLARHLESGKLGDYDPKLIRTLLQRACTGGDPDGCGEPKTAAETFH